MSSLIQADRLVRFYGNQCAVQDVSFSLEKGEILGFLGYTVGCDAMNSCAEKQVFVYGRLAIKRGSLRKITQQAFGFAGFGSDVDTIN